MEVICAAPTRDLPFYTYLQMGWTPYAHELLVEAGVVPDLGLAPGAVRVLQIIRQHYPLLGLARWLRVDTGRGQPRLYGRLPHKRRGVEGCLRPMGRAH